MKKLLCILCLVAMAGCELLPEGEGPLESCSTKERRPTETEAQEICEAQADCHTVGTEFDAYYNLCLKDILEDGKYALEFSGCAIVAHEEHNKGNLKCTELYRY